LKVGDEIEIMPPQGRFYADVKTDDYKTFYLFAAGSGITPIISILKSVLYSTTHSLVRLFYGNANQDTIIFKEELERLELEFTNRLKIVHTLSSPKVWSVWKQWSGRKGRIDSKAVEWFIKNYPPVAQSTEYYICGPGAMNMSIRNTLMRLDVPKTLIHIEQFAGSLDNADLDIDAVENATLDISLNGQKHELTIPKGQTILETLKSAKVSVPYSCEGGICGTCIAKVTKGKTAMKSCMALEEKEITKGWILTCQALPLTEKIEIEFS
jgi:ring-1,2-phenylacetyl-CoA epoxidase subunit PaaE